jgi:UDPglucose--hexose-1-phosphate uridylyltransferase
MYMSKPILKSEIRKHYFLNKYVIITPGRSRRPRDMMEETMIKKDGLCVFCPEKIDKKQVIDDLGGLKNWQMLVMANKFPAVTLDNPKAYGVQEVIVETPEHGPEIADFDEDKIADLLKIYAKRTKAVSKNDKIDYVLIFKNSGSKAGASLYHSHSQLFATKLMPPEVLDEIVQSQNYKSEKGTCPYCDIIKKEMKSERKIYEDALVAAIAPYASEYHYETWIFPKRHLDNITKLNDEEFQSFAKIFKKVLLKLKKLNISYNLYVHQVISFTDQHFYLKIQPRDSIWAGVELGSGLIINSVSPEEAARYYRK